MTAYAKTTPSQVPRVQRKHEKPVVFIVGVGRSGTSLVHSMLGSHSQLAFPPETAFARRFVLENGLDGACRTGRVASFLDDDSRVQRTGLHGASIVAKAGDDVNPAGLYRAFLQAYQDDAGKPGVGDKDPRAVEWIAGLVAVLPGVRIVHVIRDPRDVLLSKKKADWSATRGLLWHVFAARVQLRLGRIAGGRLAHNQYHELIYERLLDDPAGELQRLCGELGLEYEANMLEFSGSAERLVSPDEMQWKKETLGPLLTGNQGKWKCQLSDWEVALVEQLCDEHFRVGGYEKSRAIRRLPLVRQTIVYGIAALMGAATPVYCGYRRGKNWRAKQRL